MSKRRKRKLLRLENKYRSFNLRTLTPNLFVAMVLFLGGMAVRPDASPQGGGQENGPLLNFAFIWTGFICCQLSGQFLLGALCAQLEKTFSIVLWQFAWACICIGAGVAIAVLGDSGATLLINIFEPVKRLPFRILS